MLPISREPVVRTDVSAAGERPGHPHALQRVLENLAISALDFGDAGVVEIAARPIGAGRVAFSIAAAGRGMDPERLPTLYSPFYSVPGQPHGRFSASGPAHRVARLLVEAMGSELHLENGDDSGVRWSFDLDLPLVA